MQLKGTQKRMIAIKTSESDMFEEAYFVLKANIDNSNSDMVAEAERIIKSRAGVSEQAKKPIISKKAVMAALVFFLLGVIVGGLIFSLI